MANNHTKRLNEDAGSIQRFYVYSKNRITNKCKIIMFEQSRQIKKQNQVCTCAYYKD